jgi:hypothetical protein
LIESIENRPLAVLGNKVAFAREGSARPHFDATGGFGEDANPIVLAEKLVSVPARGVFAEAKLGHCNACEVIDNTRFWDWQQSPIPEKPTAITPPDPNVRRHHADATDKTTPSTMPAPIVNIVNPPAAPEPTGMSAALGLLGASNIFRDMSAQQEVASLLQSLVAASAAMATGGAGRTGPLAPSAPAANAGTGAGAGVTTRAPGDAS